MDNFRNIRSKSLYLIVSLVFILTALLACQHKNKPDKPIIQATIVGPDKKPIPDADDIVAKGKKIIDIPHTNLVVILNAVEQDKKKAEDEAKEKGKSAPKKGKTTVKFKSGESTKVNWKKVKDGCKITYIPPNAERTTHVTVTETPDGSKSISIFEEMGFVHYGERGIFMGKYPGCKNLLWLQYEQRNFVFKNKDGKEIEKKQIGPGIDEQIPYKYQTQFDNGSGSMMQDDAGLKLNKQSTKSQKQLAKDALELLKNDANVNNDKIISADVTWKLWTYLICTDPYKVIGHYEWGFSVNVTPESNPPQHMEQKDEKKPVWFSKK